MLGVIGGNGVAATNRLLQLIEEKCTQAGAFRDAHHPEKVIWQATKAPSRSMYLEGRGPTFVDDYVEIGRKLKQCGCTELCMCCNTAHYAIEELRQKIGLPFISIIDEVAKFVVENRYRKVGVLCTDGCLKTRLYDKSFSRYVPDVKLYYPDSIHQQMVTKGICNAKSIKRYEKVDSLDFPMNLWKETIRWLIDSYSLDCIVLGCTDISPLFDKDLIKVPVIDSLEMIADIIANRNKNS